MTLIIASNSAWSRIGRGRAPLAMLALATLPAIAALPNPASATPLANPTYEVAYFSQALHWGAGTYVGTGYSATLTSQPSLTLNAYGIPGIATTSPYETQYFASVGYQVMIAGPNAYTMVPVDVTFFMSVSDIVVPGGYAVAGTRFSYYDKAVDLDVFGHASGSETDGATVQFSVAANTPFWAGFSGIASFYDTGDQASIFIDPVFSIDPSFASNDPNYLTDYTLAFSPGIQNSEQPVPEPGSLLLLASGVACMCGVIRFRKP
jgi:hypothetical protein